MSSAKFDSDTRLNHRETDSQGGKSRPVHKEGVPPPRRFSNVSIVFPAFNEEENIRRAVDEARRAFSRYFRKVEIIVVNDGSSDRTRELVDALSRESSDVIALHHDTNLGYGAALKSGFDQAQNDFIFFTDSDLQFDLDEIERLLPWLDSHDIVVGYRALRADPAVRRLNAWAWNVVIRVVLGVKVRDLDCAFKIFRQEQLKSMRIDSVGAMVSTEILYLAKRAGARFKEVPVSHYPRMHGQQTGADLRVILKAFRELWRMYWKANRPGGSRALGVEHRQQDSVSAQSSARSAIANR